MNSQVESLKEVGIDTFAVGPLQPVEKLDFSEESEYLPSHIYTAPEYFATKLEHRLSTLSNVLKLVIDEVQGTVSSGLHMTPSSNFLMTFLVCQLWHRQPLSMKNNN